MTNMAKFSRSYYLFLIVFLGMLSAFGPFVTDMYLPTLPSMAEIFDTTPSLVQLGLATSMLGLAVGQIFFGPLSDKYGRRRVLISAMLLFAVSTVISIYSPSIQFFNLCRFLQGLGGAGGIVLSRSISTDCYSGRELAKTLAIIGAVNGIAPVTAPVIGGLVSESVGWQGIFWILFGIGIVLLGMCLVFEESLPADKRHHGSVLSLMFSFPKLLRLKYFRVYVLMFAFANGVLFAYISSASFIIQNYFGFSELVFAVIFGINALGIGIGSALSLKFGKMSKAGMFGACGVSAVALMQLACYLLFDKFIVYEVLTFVMLVFVGYIFTAATTMAMDEGREYVGAASAIFGAAGFLFGGIVSPLVGIGNIMFTTLIIIAVCSLSALTFAIMAVRRKL
ncbi:MAG: multidrug effflux MFS transporter [Duncaniella sp.]|nr:multidrug effflux MFS transporter [Duncaniella sp.]MDE7145080.1 multidrug effflux MFS transporter [Duncaniella sp.]